MSILSTKRQTIHPSRISQYCKLGQCGMYLFQEYVDEVVDDSNIDDVPLSPLYAETGMQFEQSQLEALLAGNVYSVGPEDASLSFDEKWSDDIDRNQRRIQELIDEIANGGVTSPVVLYQVPLLSRVEVWPVRSEVDVAVVTEHDGTAEIRVIEIKSATQAKTHHQIQAAVYALQFEDLHDGDSEVTASIVTRDAPLTSMLTSKGIDPTRLDTFDLATRKNDVRLLLEEGGALDDILYEADPKLPPNNRIDARCESCPKQAKCFARGVTRHGLELLGTFGITEGVQESLREFGIDTIDELVELFELPKDGRQAYQYEPPAPRDPAKVREIQRRTEISNLSDLAQVAHRFRREMDPQFDRTWKRTANNAGPWAEYLIGSGRNLPDDDKDWISYPRHSLIRIYPYIQVDHIRDRVVLLAAKVTSTRYERETGAAGQFIIALPRSLPDDFEDAVTEEERLLKDFFEKLAVAVNRVAPDISNHPDYEADDGIVHLYPYSTQQRDALMEAVKRHDTLYGSEGIQTLLGYRADIDQETVSVLQEDFRQRHALRYPGLGIVPTTSQFFGGSGFAWDNYSNGSTPITTVFAQGFFEISVPYVENNDTISLQFDEGYEVPEVSQTNYFKNHYPVLGRYQDGLPLEYIWGSEELDRMKPDWADDVETREQIIRYRHHTDEHSERINLDDVRDVVEAICDAYAHIERSIFVKDASTPKQAIPIGNLANLSFGNSTLQSTVVEYQNLEFGAQRRKRERHYRKALSERVAVGAAVPFRCDVTPEDDDIRISGQIMRDIGGGTGSGLQPDTPLAIEAGNMVVMTPLEKKPDGSYQEAVEKPQKYANSILGFVTYIDPSSGRVSINAPWRYRRRGTPCMVWHKGWTNDQDDLEDNVELVEAGTAWVLDPAVDDFAGSRARHAILHARENDIHNRLLGVYDQSDPFGLQYSSPFCSLSHIQAFLTDFDDVMDETTNQRQRKFVQQVDHSVIVAQGPPGTGKTSFGLAPATLARVYAFQRENESFGGFVSAHSNTAVDEAAESVADAHERLMIQKGVLCDLRLVRVRSGGNPVNHSNPNFEDLDYYEDRARLRELWDETMASEEVTGIVFFATPVTLRNLTDAVANKIDDNIDDLTLGNEDDVDALIRSGDARVFNFGLIDEASMMDLPLLFLCGAFLRESRQLMVIGDHRQMRPIQSHEWETEDRKTIEEHTPALSVLNFMRFLRGEIEDDAMLDYLERDPPQWSQPDDILPIVRFKPTYRFTSPIADLETRLFYHKDNLSLTSDIDRPHIPDVTQTSNLPDWARVALDPETRVTLIIHDDDQFTKDSPVEEYIANTVLDPLPVATEPQASAQQVSAGIVVPFRLQRRRMRESSPAEVEVETVEKFQGDEKDVMVLSMTAGNQGYVNSLSEFLLDENRFNVGLSRMKRKVFVIASKSIFRTISTDVKDYERQKAWKIFYDAMGVPDSAPVARTVLTDTEVSELDGNRSVNVEVYTGFAD